MARKWSKARKKQRQREGSENANEDRSTKTNEKYGQERDPYALVALGNFKMEVFYAYQGIHDYYLDETTKTFVECKTDEQKEAERQRWLTSVKSILPASFRIGNDVDDHLRERLEKELEAYVGKKMEIQVQPKGGDRKTRLQPLQLETKMIAPAKKISYVPHAYQLSLDRQTIRRNTNLNGFHEWLKVQTEAGFVSRQETVSMIPPVVLNPEPHHKVLDMCAAPGSKTSQLLELVNLPAKPGDTEPTGFVVANDADYKRAYMLVHQMRRINSPAIFICCCDAQFFPLIRSEEYPSEGLFDRVLCDVPCSGDGTSRKNPGIWKRWNQLNAMALHNLQLGIALKGARLTRVGGQMVYSTCSMNPMENESVVAELLRASEGSLELVDGRSELDGILARPGMSTWKVVSEQKSRRDEKNTEKKNNEKMQARRKKWKKDNNENGDGEKGDAAVEARDEDMVDADTSQTKKDAEAGSEDKKDADDAKKPPLFAKFEPTSYDDDVLKEMVKSAGLTEYSSYDEVPNYLRKRIRQSCFPPTEEEAAKFHLERCMRIMPQDMDTGGFFVCLLKKVAPMNARARARFEKLQEELEDKEEVNDSPGDEPEAKKVKLDAEGAKTNDGDELMKNQKDSPNVVRGHVKKIYLKDKDGKKHESLGRDDFVPIPDTIFGSIKEFYGMSSDSFEEGNYMSRACGDARTLYFITKSVKSLIETGFQEKVTVINSGLKGFTRCNKDCEVQYRIAQEGVHFVAPHMTKRKVVAEIDDFRKCLEPGNTPLSTFSEGFAAEVRALSLGSFVVCLKGYENDYLKKLVLVVWRCRSDTSSTMANQVELDGMKSRLRSIVDDAAETAA